MNRHLKNFNRSLISRILFVALLCCAINVIAKQDQLIIDQYMSPYAGAALNLSIFHTYKFLDDRYLPSSVDKVTVPWILGRIGKLAVEEVLSQLLMVFQHEVFGHGYRTREFGFTDVGYYVSIGHGYTSFTLEDFEPLSYPERAALSAAGMEANAVLSQQLRENWVLENQVDHRDALFYFITSLDQAEYILGTPDEATSLGNDVNSYVSEINTWYNNTALSKQKLRNYALWELFDPSLYVGLYSIGTYVLDGKPHIPMLMLDIKHYRYMFAPRLLLTPYGPEFQLQNYLLTPKHELLQINLRYGNNSSIQSYGLDFFMRPIWQYKEWQFGNKLFLWRQPNFLQQNIAVGLGNRCGVADFVAVEYRIHKMFTAIGEFGYKTAGYIQGMPLGNSWVWRVGLSLRY